MYATQTADLRTQAATAAPAAVVTDDLAKVGNIVSAGKTAIVVMPPSIRFETPTVRILTWTLFVAAGPDPVRAAAPLDQILDQIAGPLDLTAADPVSIPTHQGQMVAGYQCTTEATYINE